MRFLATTNRGLEDVAIDEIEQLVGGQASLHHPGMVAFEASPSAVCTLHRWARSLHRVMIQRTEGSFDELDDIYAIARTMEVVALFDPELPFAVRAQRHGKHEFGSPDVERVVGQAVVDEHREAGGVRPPVDLDDPAVIFRVLVRHDSVLIAVDATGQRSLHRRWYRAVEHDAPLRPTVAYSMLHLAGYDGSRRLVDPMCGSGTIPIEAGLSGTARPPTPKHEPLFPTLRLFEYGPNWRTEAGTDPRTHPETPAEALRIAGFDHSQQCIAASRTNAEAAQLDGLIEFSVQDATETPPAGDIIVTDLPFGVRTDRSNLAGLYEGFFNGLSDRDWDSLVLLTAREDLVPFDPTARYELRRGRLEVSLLLIE